MVLDDFRGGTVGSGGGSPVSRTIAYDYDGLDRLTGADETSVSPTDYAYSYDDAGNRTGVWVNGTRTITQTYNAANQGRYLSNVRIWKQGERRVNISIYKLVRDGFLPTVWYIVSDLRFSLPEIAA